MRNAGMNDTLVRTAMLAMPVLGVLLTVLFIAAGGGF